MEHLLLFSYIMLFSTGFAGLAALVFLRVRVRGVALPYFIAIQSFYLLGLALEAMVFYGRNIALFAFREAALDVFPLQIAAGLAGCALYFCAWGVLRAQGLYRRRRGGSPLGLIASITTLATGFLMLGGALFAAVRHFSGASLPPWLTAPSFLSYLPAAASLLLTGLLLFRLRLDGEHPAYLLLLRGYGAALLAFVPLTVLEAVLESASWVPYRPLSLDFLFFLGWNIAAVVAFLRSMAAPGEAPPLVDEVPQQIADNFGLTPREKDMILLIARGFANKRIASELGISEATVRTHIYNLYRKVGAGSRVELLNKIRV